MKKDLPKLFAAKNEILILKLNLYSNEKEILGKTGDKFYVFDIIEYGFDLISLDNSTVKVRLLNSQMDLYFETSEKFITDN